MESAVVGTEGDFINSEIDINPKAIELARQNIDFDDSDLFNNKKTSIELRVGDARDLSFIESNSVDLICSHPPYADIINYTDNNPSDLSHYPVIPLRNF